MIACLRSTRFMWPDGSGVVFLDLRRLHNLSEQRHNKGFVVSRRLKVDGKSVQSDRDKKLRHPFTGVHLAMACGCPDEVSHIVAAHAGEGNMVQRSTEAYIVHHADFMSYEPFKNLR